MSQLLELRGEIPRRILCIIVYFKHKIRYQSKINQKLFVRRTAQNIKVMTCPEKFQRIEASGDTNGCISKKEPAWDFLSSGKAGMNSTLSSPPWIWMEMAMYIFSSSVYSLERHWIAAYEPKERETALPRRLICYCSYRYIVPYLVPALILAVEQASRKGRSG